MRHSDVCRRVQNANATLAADARLIKINVIDMNLYAKLGLFLSGATLFALALAPVASAHQLQAGARAVADVDDSVHTNMGLHLGLGLGDDMQARHASSTQARIQAREDWRETFASEFSHVTAGVVTAVDGAVFTIDPFGNRPTTTVSTNSSTVFKVGTTTSSSSDVKVGDKVFVMGTTTATSTASDSFAASVVRILGEGLGHLRFWMWFGHDNK